MPKPTLNIRERLKSIAEQEKAPASGAQQQHPARLFFQAEPPKIAKQTVGEGRAGNRPDEKAIANSANALSQTPPSAALANSANAFPNPSPRRRKPIARAKNKPKANPQAKAERRFRGKAQPKPEGWLGLRPNDREVFYWLRSLCRPQTADETEGASCTPPVGYKTISANTGISMRQAQICVQRLEEAGYLRRIGSDKTHPDLTQRGMVYEVVLPEDTTSLLATLRARQSLPSKTDG